MRRPLAATLALVALVAACSSDTKTTTPTAAPPAGSTAEATYFFNHRDKLKPATPDLAGALRLGLMSFSQPSGRKVEPGEPTLTLDLSLHYQKPDGPDIVILDVIPWRVGDIEKGPGARLTKTKRYGLLLKANERATVNVPLVVEKVGGAPATTAPGMPVPGATPVPGAPPSAPTRSLGRSAGGLLGQVTPDPSPPVQPPRPVPSATPGVGPQVPPSPGGPFDPNTGVQVIVVAAFVGEGVTAESFKTVTLVPEDAFATTYGKYAKVEVGIPVPTDRLL